MNVEVVFRYLPPNFRHVGQVTRFQGRLFKQNKKMNKIQAIYSCKKITKTMVK